ncbi:MAG: single-stranded-DNA-specific exonuclease RecJ [Gammaproteobacteria bacterium]|nr:single-stranded-DNA-specific exonuclease RecJ [Gammaproteobacteria bacterium]
MARDSVIRHREVRRRSVPAEYYDALPDDMDPVLRRVYAARQVRPGELETALSCLLPVRSLGGLDPAVGLLCAARSGGASVLVVGDYDADGATASALMVDTLRRFGFPRVDYLVPNRFQFGYGLSPAIAELAAARGAALLVTVDNGVNSFDGVKRAQELGMRVLVTDHHLPGCLVPPADAIVNPNLQGDGFASKALCGVGVVFYLMAALARELDLRGQLPYESARGILQAGLDLVALGTVADLVPLDHNNRILVAEGLRRLRSGRGRAGIVALFRVAGRNPTAAHAADFGFAIAPRLNAAGRLTDMSLGVECLLAEDPGRAARLAAELDSLNSQRRELQSRMTEEAERHLRALSASLDAGRVAPASCLFDPAWHEGIVGLVASRIRERTGRPAIAFARSEGRDVIKGSARSVPGVHVRDALALVAARGEVEGLEFGGHAMAAGVRIPMAGLERFTAAFSAAISVQLALAEPDDILWTDGPLDPDQCSVEMADRLQLASPWGQAFPEPLFHNRFEIVDRVVLKGSHLRLVLTHEHGGEPIEAIAFNETRELPGHAGLVYRLGVNDFGGRRRRQLVVEHVQPE